MRGCLEVIVVLIVLIFLITSILGFWHFVSSEAMEAQAWKIVDSISGVIVLVGKGFLVVLVCVGFFLICKGVKEAAEPIARAAGTYKLVGKASQLMLPNPGIEMPDIRIWPEVREDVQCIAPDEFIGGDLPVRDVRLLESEHQT